MRNMKTIVAFLVIFFSFHAYAQTPKPATLRSILLEQLRTTHNEKDWFYLLAWPWKALQRSRPVGRMAAGTIPSDN